MGPWAIKFLVHDHDWWLDPFIASGWKPTAFTVDERVKPPYYCQAMPLPPKA